AGELYYERKALPPLRSLPEAQDVVIHQGTFSKALSPGLRVGWLVAPSDVIARVRTAKRASDLSTNSLAQVVLANYLKDGLYVEHLEHVKAVYRRRRDTMLRALNKQMSFKAEIEDRRGRSNYRTKNHLPAIRWIHPKGGLFIWVQLPEGFSSRELLKLAERE